MQALNLVETNGIEPFVDLRPEDLQSPATPCSLISIIFNTLSAASQPMPDQSAY
jgi:hypothetical protein